MGTINALSIPVSGPIFTWKKRIHTHLIYEQLDKAIGRNDWVNMYLDSFVTHESFSCSDHCPIILSDSTPSLQRKKFSCRFQNYWCQFYQLDPIIRKQWSIQPQGTKMFILTQKLKHTKQHLKEWSRKFLGNNHQRLSLNAQKIQMVEEKLINQPDSHRLNSWMNRLLVQREKLLLFNQKYWGNLKRKE